MTLLVVDASVAVKWVCDEEHSARAAGILGAHDLTAPGLLYSEVASALARRAAAGDFDTDAALRKMRMIVRAGVTTVPDELLACGAISLSGVLRHPVYDCFYLALAIAEETRVVTADRALIAAAEAGGYGECVVWVEDAE
ncbi:MAG: type II toxin-antitoxin system VapC family toxin [Actinobacteria bacterium]|nr:MAG: type II toxin-antitoxin system VapC family toxin [Actinomycetota bacterium]